MTTLFRIAAGSLLAAGLTFASANAAEHKFSLNMTSAQEVPANTSAGKGTAEITVNDATKEVSWTVTFDGLTGDATAAHIHGPAAPGANAGVVVALVPPGSPVKSPVTGKATLTDAQLADILAGKDYINVHTAQNKGGEIRAQITGK